MTDYLDWCATRETDCAQKAGYGGYWSNASCEKQFGPGSSPRTFDGDGSPRWKQRAFYDFLKDAAPICFGVPMSRLSIWESIQLGLETALLADALDACAVKNDDELVELGRVLRQRIDQRSFSAADAS